MNFDLEYQRAKFQMVKSFNYKDQYYVQDSEKSDDRLLCQQNSR